MWSIDIKETGSNIQRLRKRSGYTVKELQRAMNPISYQAIYKWQQGKTLPSIDNLVILSELFHVPIEQILVRET